MKRYAKTTAIVAAALLLATGAAFAQTAGGAAMPQHGTDMTGTDHGAMTGAAAGGCPMGGMGQQAAKLAKPLTVDDVKALVTKRLAAHGNERLKVGKVTEKDANTIVAEVVTVDNSLVRTIEFDRNTGWPKTAGAGRPGMGGMGRMGMGGMGMMGGMSH
jgi:hypothetical protein